MTGEVLTILAIMFVIVLVIQYFFVGRPIKKGMDTWLEQNGNKKKGEQ